MSLNRLMRLREEEAAERPPRRDDIEAFREELRRRESKMTMRYASLRVRSILEPRSGYAYQQYP